MYRLLGAAQQVSLYCSCAKSFLISDAANDRKRTALAGSPLSLAGALLTVS